ncbi:MAG TPA: ornithine carbamoyltransferase, partial [Tianweitania sediminis]|nr:ornithine carbamoyltransferase [Tianweitania sediminis]
MSVRHFTDLATMAPETLRAILQDAETRKRQLKAGERSRPLEGKALAMIFDKPSTRTRVSFDVGMRQLGGETIMLTGTEMQLGRSETIADTAKVLSRYVDAIMIRTTDHARLVELTENATIPVINGLTDETHPCQLMADVMTYEEHRGPVKDKLFAWTGDGNNVLHSLIEASARFEFRLNVAVPAGSEPVDRFTQWANANGGRVTFTKTAEEAVDGADCVLTDTWV